MSSLADMYGFCQFGGHNQRTQRKRRFKELNPILFVDNSDIYSCWLTCSECTKQIRTGDLSINVLYNWANEGIANTSTNQLPDSLRENPLRQSLLVQYVDEFLNNNIRKKLGNRFPAFLSDSIESEKNYFILELDHDPTLRSIFLYDIKNGIERKSVALKLWVGATMAAKATRHVYNAQTGGQQEYDFELRKEGFQEADSYAGNDEIIRIGVEICPILELIIRSHPNISLQGAKVTSPVRRYLKIKDKDFVTKEDLDFSSNKEYREEQTGRND
jgi:hypothetical protein